MKKLFYKKITNWDYIPVEVYVLRTWVLIFVPIVVVLLFALLGE